MHCSGIVYQNLNQFMWHLCKVKIGLKAISIYGFEFFPNILVLDNDDDEENWPITVRRRMRWRLKCFGPDTWPDNDHHHYHEQIYNGHHKTWPHNIHHHHHKNNLAFISAGISGPNIFDHENELCPSPGDDGSVAWVQRVCHVVHLWQSKFHVMYLMFNIPFLSLNGVIT